MLRNVAGQKWRVYAWDTTTGLPKTGDAANISAYITKDFGTAVPTNDAAPAEVSLTNQPGYYDFDLTQSETNAHTVSLAAKSSTSNVVVLPCQPVQNPVPQYLSSMGVTSDGVVDADVEKVAGSTVAGVDDFKADLTGIALTTDLTSARDAILTEGAASWTTADVSGIDLTGVATEAKQDTIISAVAGVPAAVDSTLTAAHGAGSWVSSESSGSGAYVVTLTVDDGAVALVGAIVRVTDSGGVESFVATTDSSGEVSFSLDAATWTVSITKPFYSYPPSSLVVSGDTEDTLSMTQVVVSTPTDPLLCTVVIKALDEEGAAQEGVTITMTLRTVPSGSEGYAFSGDEQVELTGADGSAQFTAVRGATYDFSRGTGACRQMRRETLPLDQASVTVDSFIG